MKVEDFFLVLDRESFSKYVMPYYEENGVFYTQDGGVGIAFESVPLSGAYTNSEQALRSALSLLPSGAVVQFILWGGSDIFHLIDYWLANKMSGLHKARNINADLVEEMIRNYHAFLESRRKEPITKTFKATLKNHRLFITLKLGGKEREYRLFDKLFGFLRKDREKQDGADTVGKNLKALLEVKERFIGALSSGAFACEVMDGQKMVEVLYKLINPSRDWRDYPRYDGSIPIARASVHADNVIKVYEDYVEVDGYYVRALSVKSYPEEWGFMDIPNYLGSPYEESNYDFDYLMVLNAVKLPDKEKAKIKRDAGIVLSQQVPYALVPRLKFKHQDLAYAMERIEKGEDLYAVDFLVIVYSRTKEELDLRTGRVKSEFRKLGFQLEEDAYINLPDFISALPFGFDLKMAEFLTRQRVRVFFEENVVSLAPVYAGWKGTKPEVFFVSNTGELVGFDFFSNPAGGYNSFVVGMTGSGKSVLLQFVALNYLAGGNRVWIIDIGGSYERLAKLVDGDYIELKMESPLCINPFSSIENYAMLEDYLEFLINLFYLMGASKEITKALEDEKLIRAYLEEAIKDSYDRYGVESSVDTVVEMLRKHITDQRVADFVKSLTPYTSMGQYGKFFNGRSDIRFDKWLTVFENGHVENVPDLRDPVIMLLTFHISKDIYLQQADYRHLVIIDEAHKFLGNPKIDLFVEQAYRRFRKHGASMILGTQGFEDFMPIGSVSRAGRVVVENSFWNVFMMQRSTSKNALRESKRYSFSDYEWGLMDSVRARAGEFSELFLTSEYGSVKLRVVLDEFMKALFFTDPETRRRIRELVDKGMSYLEAVKKLQEERGQ